MALNLGRMDYRQELTPDDIARFNRLLEAVEHMWDNLLMPSAPVQCNDFHFFINQDSTSQVVDNVDVGNPDQSQYITYNFWGSEEFPTYVTFNEYVYTAYYSPVYFYACVIFAGITPTAPTTKPTVTVNGGGTGNWPSGTYRFKITYVDSTGAESPASPESDAVVVVGSPSLTINLNNTPPASILYWKVYATQPDGASNSEVLIVAADPGPPAPPSVYEIAIGTTSYTIPRPIYTTNTPPTSSTTPGSCVVLPTCCGRPTWTGKYGEVAIDMCGSTDSCNSTNPTAPILYVQVTAPSGTNWKGIFDYTQTTNFACNSNQALMHMANASGLVWKNVQSC